MVIQPTEIRCWFYLMYFYDNFSIAEYSCTMTDPGFLRNGASNLDTEFIRNDSCPIIYTFSPVILEFSLNFFSEFAEFSDKNITVKGLEPLPTSHLLC